MLLPVIEYVQKLHVVNVNTKCNNFKIETVLYHDLLPMITLDCNLIKCLCKWCFTWKSCSAACEML